MANKQTTRPGGVMPSWANNTAISDVGEDWHNQLTKVQPGSGLRDTGFVPAADVEAQHVNQLLHELGQWVQYLSDIQFQNWMSPITVTVEASVQFAAGEWSQGLIWDDTALEWYLIGSDAGDDLVCLRSSDLHIWTDFGDSAAGIGSLRRFRYGYSKPAAASPSHAGRYIVFVGSDTGVDGVNYRRGDVAWQEATLPDDSTGDAVPTCGVYFEGGENFLVGGAVDGSPAIWYAPYGTTLSFTLVLPTPINSSTIVDMCTDGSIVIAVGDGDNGEVWVSDDGETWDRYATVIDAARGCWFSAERSLWMIVTEGGQVYTSTDPASGWTLRSTLAGIGAFDVPPPFGFRVLRSLGGAWICPRGNGQDVYVSTDDGVTWRTVVPPLAGSLSDGVVWTSCVVCPTQQRIALACARPAANAVVVTQSLSVGTVLRSATTGADTVPTVT